MDKYFTPSIEELRIGYKCELKGVARPYNWDFTIPRDNVWREGKLTYEALERLYKSDIPYEDIRVPYLTQAHLEERGYVESKYSLLVTDFTNFSRDTITKLYEKDSIKVYYSDSDQKTNIYKNDNCLYSGTCKDPNTFDYICKLLNIE